MRISNLLKKVTMLTFATLLAKLFSIFAISFHKGYFIHPQFHCLLIFFTIQQLVVSIIRNRPALAPEHQVLYWLLGTVFRLVSSLILAALLMWMAPSDVFIIVINILVLHGWYMLWGSSYIK